MDKSDITESQRARIEKVVEEKDNQFYCIVVRNCGHVQKNQNNQLNHGNFLRHIRSKHPEKLTELDLPLTPVKRQHTDESPQSSQPKRGKKDEVVVKTNRMQVMLGTLQLVTTHSLPLCFGEWEGIQMLVKPLWDAYGWTINRRTLTDLVAKAAKAGRERIMEEVKGRIIHFKMDSASRRNHHSFAVGAQYYMDGKIVSRHLVMKEMVVRQTAENLQETIQTEAMEKYGINPNQLLTIAHDNGQNMVASVRYLKTMLVPDRENGTEDYILGTELRAVETVINELGCNRLHHLEAVDEAHDEDDASEDECEDFTSDNEEEAEDGDDEMEEPPPTLPLVSGTRCAVHTCQLAVWDVLKKYTKSINAVKKLVKLTRLTKYRTTFLNHKACLPPVCNATRWNGVYIMLKSLRDQKAFFLILENNFAEMSFSKHWRFIDELCEALHPLFFLTVNLQHEHVALSEFFAQWLICQAQLARLKENKLSKKLLMAMERRLNNLTNTMHFKACLYIDPRFNYIGSNRISPADKHAIQRYLLELHARIDEIEGKVADNPELAPTEESNFIEDYLQSYFSKDTLVEANSVQVRENNILMLIKEMELRPKVGINTPSAAPSTSTKPPSKFDILQYWERERSRNSEMHRLAVALISAPSTQASVERAFSGLKFVLTDHRQRLGDDRIQDIMMLKLNPDLLPVIAEKLAASSFI